MSRAISLKISEDIFAETEAILKKVHVPRNSYINRALAFYNLAMTRSLLKKQYALESTRVSKESRRINREFASLQEDWPDA